MSSSKLGVYKSVSRIKKGNLPPIVLWHGLEDKFLDALPAKEKFDLVVTSPPYNIGKPYELSSKSVVDYIDSQKEVIHRCVARLKSTGSICWQVGNYIDKGKNGKATSIIPIDVLLFNTFLELGLKLRNRIVWHYRHGFHSKHRFSGRYEVILWFTKSDEYYFDLDSVRDPNATKYPGKRYYKGPKKGQYSSNPLGQNPSDIWDIPNVKSNHVEKTSHPCQFPVGLIERLVLALTPKTGTVFDPFSGVASAGVASIIHERKYYGCEKEVEYVNIAKQRMLDALNGKANYRPHDKAIYDHTQSNLSKRPTTNAAN